MKKDLRSMPAWRKRTPEGPRTSSVSAGESEEVLCVSRGGRRRKGQQGKGRTGSERVIASQGGDVGQMREKGDDHHMVQGNRSLCGGQGECEGIAEAEEGRMDSAGEERGTNEVELNVASRQEGEGDGKGEPDGLSLPQEGVRDAKGGGRKETTHPSLVRRKEYQRGVRHSLQVRPHPHSNAHHVRCRAELDAAVDRVRIRTIDGLGEVDGVHLAGGEGDGEVGERGVGGGEGGWQMVGGLAEEGMGGMGRREGRKTRIRPC